MVLRLIVLLSLLSLGLLLGYQNFKYPHLRAVPLTERIKAPLDQRIRYRIGEIDPRFGLSTEQVQQLALEATQIWNTAHQDYFVYDPNARLRIDFIYDQRQIETQQREQQRSQIQAQQQIWQQHYQEIEGLKQQLVQLDQQLSEKIDALRLATRQYNQKVNYLNQQGGVSSAQHTVLEQQKYQLQQQQQVLNQEIASHQLKVQSINQQVQQLNQMNQQLSEQVAGFNTTFAGKQFDKGVFNGKQIVIYEFSSIEDLRLTLAHEFGHALGLGHHDDPYGLMYPIMQKQNLDNFALTSADFDLLHH